MSWVSQKLIDGDWKEWKHFDFSSSISVVAEEQCPVAGKAERTKVIISKPKMFFY